MSSRTRWLGGGLWSIADQGLFAGSNFILSLLLARLLTPEYYGAFAVSYAVFWIVGTFYGALLIEPMAIFGPGRYKDHLPQYLGMLHYGHWGWSIIISLLLLLASLCSQLLGYGTLSAGLVGLAIAAPLMLFHQLTRRVCYVLFKPHFAAFAGAVYLMLILVGIYVLYRLNKLSPVTAFGLMGFASLGASIWLVVRLGVGRLALANDGPVREVVSKHWSYGRWALPSNALIAVTDSAYYLLLPILGGLELSAAYRAVMNFALPGLHVATALQLYLLSSFAPVRGRAEFGHLTRLALATSLLGSGLYWVLLGLFHSPITKWMYGGHYIEYSKLLWIVGLIPLARMAVGILNAVIRSLERPNQVFWAQIASTIIALTVGLGFMIAWGVAGAVAGYLASQVAAAGALWWFWIKGAGGTSEPDSKTGKVGRS